MEHRGVHFPQDEAVLTPRLRRMMRRGRYEGREASAVRRVVGPDDRVLELGGGVGFIGTLAALRGAAVLSFEANPALVPYIRRVHEANGVTDRAAVRGALLSPEGGPPLDFHVREEFDASSLDPAGSPGMAVLAVERVEQADARAVFAEFAPTVLVCDIEGGEAALVPRLPLDGLRAAILELHPRVIGSAGVAGIFAAMAAAGLVFFPKASEGNVATFRRDW